MSVSCALLSATLYAGGIRAAVHVHADPLAAASARVARLTASDSPQIRRRYGRWNEDQWMRTS